ncbi:MAG TPA: hypothetical protein VG013_17555 [Gemmataceae bacterium]|jgi:hypothetical protein|nr:hypothetical protein [Gemmataceae bacterium]
MRICNKATGVVLAAAVEKSCFGLAVLVLHGVRDHSIVALQEDKDYAVTDAAEEEYSELVEAGYRLGRAAS